MTRHSILRVTHPSFHLLMSTAAFSPQSRIAQQVALTQASQFPALKIVGNVRAAPLVVIPATAKTTDRVCRPSLAVLRFVAFHISLLNPPLHSVFVMVLTSGYGNSVRSRFGTTLMSLLSTEDASFQSTELKKDVRGLTPSFLVGRSLLLGF